MTTRTEIRANPKCPDCKGKGIRWFMVGDEPERDGCECLEEVKVEMKRFRGSIYYDIEAESKQEAEDIAIKMVNHLDAPDSIDAPKGYFNAYFGGVGRWIVGDLFGNMERLKDI